MSTRFVLTFTVQWKQGMEILYFGQHILFSHVIRIFIQYKEFIQSSWRITKKRHLIKFETLESRSSPCLFRFFNSVHSVVFRPLYLILFLTQKFLITVLDAVQQILYMKYYNVILQLEGNNRRVYGLMGWRELSWG